MKSFLLLIGLAVGLGCGVALTSCVGTASTKEVHEVDSLNRVAYALRYKDLDASAHAAWQAYGAASLYKSGKAEACNNLGFCAFMQMDFEQAEKWHLQVYGCTMNEAELLIADIGLMKIYQRTALNKEFYDYRNSALRRMKRIAEDDALFADRHERMRLNYARSEFHIVSAVYYFYLQQRPEALADLQVVAGRSDELAGDTNQWLYYHYIKGAAALCEGETAEQRRLREFDELYGTWLMAARQGYLYFEGNGLQGLANLMVSADNYELFRARRAYALGQFHLPVDSLLPLRLGQQALLKFRQYNDLYQIAGAYVSIGKYLNMHGRYGEALDTLRNALECVNQHHRRYYDCHDTLDWLKTYDRRDTMCVEMAWMQQKLKTVPEWISRIREQLSVTYAGLGRKEESDYNRNVYLDILEDTRQDKELESRYQALEKEARQLNLILLAVGVGFLVVGLLFWLFNKRSKARNHLYQQRMRQLLDICQLIIGSIPTDAQTEEEIVESIRQAVGGRLDELFGMEGVRIGGQGLVLPERAGKDKLAMAHVIEPYIRWALENGMTSISLGDERKRLEKQRYIHEQHIAGNKRRNVVKRACLAVVDGMNPYIDRIANEVRKLTEKGFLCKDSIKREKFQYIDELVTTINESNEVLARWVKVRQGTLSLNIETFELNELFALLQKGNRAFEMKRQKLVVELTDACVKADRALTLFIINTLAENARKFTPPGGTIRISAKKEDGYVEISVEDNGRGLSPEDVARIVGEKVYDSKAIGRSQADDWEELQKNKGSGFGLMNCKGIIEQYRKTDGLFRVCLFNVESVLGQGSRFFFRLPAGVRKVLAVVLLGWGLASCAAGSSRVGQRAVLPVGCEVWEQEGYEALLDSASAYANVAYYCNVDGEYKWALAYIDSAMMCLNAHYERYSASPGHLMTLFGEGNTAELDWWDEPFYSDFHVILDIRNEAAVAFLALKQWREYAYNNAAYTTLYKLLGEDRSLEDYCNRLEGSTRNKVVGVWLAVFLFVALLTGYYVLYFRRRLLDRWNLEQVLEINHQVFAASLQPPSEGEEDLLQEENALGRIPQRIVDEAFDAVHDLLGIDRWGIAVYNESTHRLEGAFAPIPVQTLDGEDECASLMQRCLAKQAPVTEQGRQALPLLVEAGGRSRCVGVLCLERREEAEQPADRLLLALIVRYVAVVVFNSVVKLATKYRDIEAAHDEAQRASWEDSVLHVQNMVLDNCLSTIKHETLYYPNKVKLLIGKLRAGGLTEAEERETVEAISELVAYYKGVFTILSRCASRQLEEITFRRTAVPVGELLEAAAKYFRKAAKGNRQQVELQVEPSDGEVSGDKHLLCFLLENLIDEALSVPLAGALRLRAVAEEGFVRFLFTDTRRDKPQEELNRLFYPDLSRMVQGEKGELHGTEYLVCKQIVREHDEYAGQRGCRINAVTEEGGGFTVYFTIPRRKRKEG